MFSFFLNLQAYFEKLKKNKGIWFTMMTTGAVFGIVISLYYMTSLTNRSASKLYESTHKSYIAALDEGINSRVEHLKTVYNLLSNNAGFAAAFNNQADANGISNSLKNVSAIINIKDEKAPEDGDSGEIILDFYNDALVLVASSNPNQKITGAPSDLKSLAVISKDKNPISGVELQDGNIYVRYITPFKVGGKTSGYLQIKTRFGFVAKKFSVNSQYAQVLFEKDFLDMKKIQEYKFQTVGKNLINMQSSADASFLDAVGQMDYDELIKKQYLVEKGYFVAAKVLTDPVGAKIGVLLIGEDMMKDGSLPKMAKGVANGVTVAAIGLVVALLVLMI